MIVIYGVPWGGEVFPKRILSFSVPRGSRVFSSLFPSLGSIFQSDNLHLTLHPQGIGFRFTFLTGDWVFFPHSYTRSQTHMPSYILNSSTWACHRFLKFNFQKLSSCESPGGPVVRTPHFHCRGPGFNPGTEIPQAAWWSQKKKKIELPLENLYFPSIPYFRG